MLDKDLKGEVSLEDSGDVSLDPYGDEYSPDRDRRLVLSDWEAESDEKSARDEEDGGM